MNSKRILSHNLYRLRKQKGLTQEQLSELSGVSPREISKIEQCKVDPRTSIVFQIAQGLGVDPSCMYSASYVDILYSIQGAGWTEVPEDEARLCDNDYQDYNDSYEQLVLEMDTLTLRQQQLCINILHTVRDYLSDRGAGRSRQVVYLPFCREFSGEEGERYNGYGIEAHRLLDSRMEVVESIADITSSKLLADTMAYRLNRCRVALCHFRDVVDDWL